MGWFRRWGAPVALLLTSAASGGAAWGLEAGVASERAALGGPRLVTPVLSARRVPEVVAAPIAERRLAADLGAWFERQPPESCLVVADEAGDISFRRNEDAALVPASTLKLLTATAALEVLGADLTFRTTVATTAPAGEVLAADVHLVGGGDPLLASPDYAARFERQPQAFTDLSRLATALAELGVRRIEGSVVGDESRYDSVRYVAGWPQRYIDQDQIGPLSALSVNDGFESYPLAPDAPGEPEAAADPARQAAAVLTRLLEDHGVEVVGEPRSGVVPAGATELAAVESAPLRDVVAQMLRESDNSTAELLLKELGRTAGRPTTEGGRLVATQALADAGIDTSRVVMADGSGLSPDNRLTCSAAMEALALSPTGPTITQGLAIAGQTGTLAERFDGTDLDGALRAKTGTLNTVTALTGVVDDDDPVLRFSMITNVPAVSLELIGAQEELARIMLGWPRMPDVSVLGPEPLARP